MAWGPGPGEGIAGRGASWRCSGLTGAWGSQWEWREMRTAREAAAGLQKAVDAPEGELHPQDSGEPLKNVEQGSSLMRFAFQRATSMPQTFDKCSGYLLISTGNELRVL